MYRVSREDMPLAISSRDNGNNNDGLFFPTALRLFAPVPKRGDYQYIFVLFEIKN